MSNRYKHAYVAVVPDPTTMIRGIRRKEDSLGMGYVFWFKIGDTGQDSPTTRIKDYRVNPSCKIQLITFEDTNTAIEQICKKYVEDNPKHQYSESPQPGKILEWMFLEDLEFGGIGQAVRSEWHALYAKDDNEAKALGERMVKLLEDIKAKPEHKFENIKTMLQTAIWQPYKGNLNNPNSMATPMVYIIVTPSIHPTAHNTGCSISNENGNATKFGRYWIRLGKSDTQTKATPYQIARNDFMTEMPDFAYNAHIVERPHLDMILRKRTVHVKMLLKSFAAAGSAGILKASADGPNKDWIYVDILSGTVGAITLLPLLQGFVDKFHEGMKGDLEGEDKDPDTIDFNDSQSDDDDNN